MQRADEQAPWDVLRFVVRDQHSGPSVRVRHGRVHQVKARNGLKSLDCHGVRQIAAGNTRHFANNPSAYTCLVLCPVRYIVGNILHFVNTPPAHTLPVL
jgi:hypothetical protein